LNKLAKTISKQITENKIKEMCTEENRIFQALGCCTNISIYNLMCELGKMVVINTLFPSTQTTITTFDNSTDALKEAIKALDDEAWNPDKRNMNKTTFAKRGKTLLQQLAQ
jgi:hypothetical protein